MRGAYPGDIVLKPARTIPDDALARATMCGQPSRHAASGSVMARCCMHLVYVTWTGFGAHYEAKRRKASVGEAIVRGAMRVVF